VCGCHPHDDYQAGPRREYSRRTPESPFCVLILNVIAMLTLSERVTSRGLCGERQVGGDGGAVAWFAVQAELAAAGLDAVFQPDQPGPGAEAGAAGFVVADPDGQRTAGHGDLYRDGGGAGVLGRVGQRFRDDVVGADLGRLGQAAAGLHVEGDRDGAAAGQCLGRGERTPHSRVGTAPGPEASA
jgi:hypothetical protein